ncbi:PREDICTED: probable ubiquitin-like-specific protease 2B isoform X2 [Nelumbo nucifera]|uniref:Probable ubiquitin-like-specific protease 2B isoform X2 n=1 Tax=Nelumbo nucifera TaxID=4432 RepID=A0A1U7ZMM4_NELNU|nr:PREDICTED: probable ubiquitin-like-specific protease 2B isoform X2 [Nelumbo nucifera]
MMMESSGKDLTVFGFKEEDEAIESVSGRYTGKFSNSNEGNLTKYNFLQCFAERTNFQRTETNNASCVEVDSSASDHKCNNDGSHVLGLSAVERATERGILSLDAVLASNPMSCEPHVCNSMVNVEPENLSGELNSFKVGSLSLEMPSSGNKQFNSTLLEPLSNSEPVDVVSDDDSMKTSSPSTSSDLVKNEDSLGQPVSDHCFDGWKMDQLNVDVVVSPDYVMYGDACCTESFLVFSCSCIKLEDSTAYGSKEWAIDDVIDIESQWCARVETAMVKLCLKLADALGAENAHETPGILELIFAVSDPNWSEKQEKITLLNERYGTIWNVVFNTELVREEDFAGQNGMLFSKRCFYNFDKTFEEVIYPKGDPDAVSISKRDVELLQPETFINDTIVDFYIKYLKNKIQPEDKNRFHFFNSFFFRKLADMDKDPSSASEGRAAFQRVHKWTRKINLFEKDYIFIPVNFNLHWSLIVICHPGEVVNFKDEDANKSLKVPCILHMDSIKGSHKGLKNLVQSYLWEEWKARQNESLEDASSKFINLRFIPLELPQQENSFDCGLFLLHYVELFLEEAPVNFNPFRITKLCNFDALQDAETGKQFAYSPSGEAFQPNEACMASSYFCKDFGATGTLWNPRICMQLDKDEDESSSPNSSGCEAQISSEIEVGEHFKNRDVVGANQPEETVAEKPAADSPEKIWCLTGSPTSASNERLENCIVEDSQEMDTMCENNGSITCQDPLAPTHHYEVESTENLDFMANHVEIGSNDPLSDSDERVVKRPRLGPPLEEL